MAATPVLPTWGNYVVPTAHLKAELEKQKRALAVDTVLLDVKGHEILSDEPDFAWTETLAQRYLRINGSTSLDGAKRRIWGILNGESVATSAHTADCLLLACGLDIERDTDIETLPGSRRHAAEMVEIHAEIWGETLREDQFAARVELLWQRRNELLWPNGYTGPKEANLRTTEKRRQRKREMLKAQAA